MYYLVIKISEVKEDPKIHIVNDWDEAIRILKKMNEEDKPIVIKFSKIKNK